MTTRAFQKIYTKIDNITKATVTLRATGVGNDELATVGGKLAQVVKIMGENVTLQIFAGTEGLSTDSEVVFHGEPPKLRVSDNLAGRFFNAYGEPLEGGEIIEGEAREIGGPTVNPFRRIQPSELIATGIAGIDLNNTIVTGQKIPFFADPDQPYNAVMANVALRAKADKIILGGMGLTNDDFLYFKSVFENAGALDRIVSFVNTTENPPVERLLVPDMALTAAEYFAVDKGEKVLVLLTDMTLYADALAIVSNRMDQIPSKDSMPGSLYSDLAKIYEKAVQLAGLTGNETVLDLYCGTGTITLCLARHAKKAIGVEIVPQAIEDAKFNAAQNGMENAEFFCMDAGQAAKMLAARHTRPDVIVVDPPRKGVSADVIEAISAMAPQRVVYVSCDPATLARDLKLLTAAGYTLQTAEAFDLFPRCAHVETVALLSRGPEPLPG